MDNRERVFAKLEEEVKDASGLVVVPRDLMGNISLGEVRHYIEVKGYKVIVDSSPKEVYFQYEAKEDLINA